MENLGDWRYIPDEYIQIFVIKSIKYDEIGRNFMKFQKFDEIKINLMKKIERNQNDSNKHRY